MTVSAAEYARRRARLMELVGEDAVALIPGAQEQLRNGDVYYPFRQDSNFLYLTGFNEPDALLVLLPGRASGEALLFCRDKDPQAELYDGARLGPEAAVSALKIDDAFPVEDIDDILPGLLEARTGIYFPMGVTAQFDQQVMNWKRAALGGGTFAARGPDSFMDIGHMLSELRLFKSAAEIKLMRRAAAATAIGHERAMRVCVPGTDEARLASELLYGFALGGAPAVAYPSIVGGGANACVMHYIRNDARLRDGDLVLIDAGCEYAGYAADVTRTFPVSGKFSRAQRGLYDVVLEAQLAAIAAVKPGASFDDPHQAALKVLVDGLRALKLLKGSAKTILTRESHRPFTVHRSSHWLGLDVHDVGDYRLGDVWRELEPGMVLTIEPGLYLMGEKVPDSLRGTGIRIEDNVLVTRTGAEVLTEAIPKAAEAMEACVGIGLQDMAAAGVQS